MSKSKRRHEEHEEHVNHERWLVSYADMMTLLMVLFIVMFAISQVDQKRFNQLKEGMAAGFGATTSPFSGQQTPMDAPGITPLTPIVPDAPDAGAPSQATGVPVKARSEADQHAADLDRARREVDRLKQLEERISRVLRAKGLRGDVSMKIDERGLSISLVSRHIVFRSNVADLSGRGLRVLDVLAPVIRALPNDVDVDGHTNQIKVKPKYYPTDWELSAARAVTVLRYLNEHGGVPADRMAAVAYGHEKPLRDPSLPDAAALNKRVDLVVRSDAPEQTRKLFATVVADHRKGT